MADYGVRIFNADGQLAVDLTETVLRYVDHVTLPSSGSGSFHVPKFSISKGFYLLSAFSFYREISGSDDPPHMERLLGPMPSEYNERFYNREPLVSWNEGQKNLEYTTYSRTQSNWLVQFFHFR